MIILARTFDYDLCRSIVADPSVYPLVSDDFSPPPDKFMLPESDDIYHVLAHGDDGSGLKMLGCWVLVPRSETRLEVHTCLLESGRGKLGFEAGKLLPEWVWENTKYKRLDTEVPEFNRAAAMFARRCGMLEYGREPKAFLKMGQLHDIILLGMSRPEES